MPRCNPRPFTVPPADAPHRVLRERADGKTGNTLIHRVSHEARTQGIVANKSWRAPNGAREGRV